MSDTPLRVDSFTGFIPVEPSREDWIRGIETGIIDTPVLPTGNWSTYLPAPQWQKLMGVKSNEPDGFETDACVSFSAEQTLATYLNFLIAMNKVPADALAFLNSNGYIVGGKVNFSPRFVAKTSGTTINGNSLPNVHAAIAKYGLVPDALWPMPTAAIEANPSNAWNIYYGTIPASVLAIGQQFLLHFQPQSEWIIYTGSSQTTDQMRVDLTVAPLQIATAVCPPWNTNLPIKGCGAGAQHATEMYAIDIADDFDIFDHYAPFDKVLASDYNITYAMRAILVPLATTTTTYPPPNPFKHTFTTQLDLNAVGSEVVAVQNALKVDGEFPITVQSTGTFGAITQTAVEAFQVKYGIIKAGGPGYGRVGPLTIAQLNKLFG
jgi:hypothetical protein